MGQIRLDGSPIEEAEFDDEPEITEVRGVYYLGNRTVGERMSFRDKLTFLSYRKTRDHYFRNFEGWGISEKLLRRLQREGFFYILLVIDGGDAQRITTVPRWFANGRTYKHQNFERQLILADSDFEVI